MHHTNKYFKFNFIFPHPPQIPLNIERSAVAEMHAAEASGQFDYEPSYTPPKTVPANEAPVVAFGSATTASTSTTIPTTNARKPSGDDTATAASGGSEATGTDASPPVIKRKNSLDDFELEIEGINLDENIDTSVSIV